jgi:hypothetical protein
MRNPIIGDFKRWEVHRAEIVLRFSKIPMRTIVDAKRRTGLLLEKVLSVLLIVKEAFSACC